VFGTSAIKEFIEELLKTEKYESAIPVINSGIGTQELMFSQADINYPLTIGPSSVYIKDININDLATNDGLSPEDFRAWFKDCDLRNMMTIIHFTKFRY
jgi:hypothetical protein